MGGQACVLYGAAEFSRDTDLALLASPENLAQLEAALGALGASVIAVPPLTSNTWSGAMRSISLTTIPRAGACAWT